MRNLLIIVASTLALAGCGQNAADKNTLEQTATDRAAMGHDGVAPGAGDAPFAASEAAMHTEMAAATGETIDAAYIAKMMAHHRGAVAMADVALAQSRDPAILRMAQTVKDTQTAEIAEMQAWQPAPAAAPTPAATPMPASPEAAAN